MRRPKEPQRHFASSEELCAYVQSTFGDTALLGFSAGKDSVGAWVQLRRFFRRIVPVYFYDVPGVDFIEDTLRYYEDFFGTRILRLPSEGLIGSLENSLFQPPCRVPLIAEAEFTRGLSFTDAMELVRKQERIPQAYMADGTRMADSFRRRLAMQRYGTLVPNLKRFHPCFDWTEQRLVAELKGAGVRLCRSYRVLKRTLEGPRYAQLARLREHFPQAFSQALFWYPFAEAELWRRQFYEEEGLRQKYGSCPECGRKMDLKTGCPIHHFNPFINR